MNLEISKIANLPTQYGDFKIQSFKDNNKEHLVVFTNTLPTIPTVRIHSECLTGDVFKSKKCDCGEQLDYALKQISKDGGMIVYLRQEGRGIGLLNKVNAYNLQDFGHDTIKANELLGFKQDYRDYSIVDEILKYFNIKKINLMTNNPLKLTSLKDVNINKRIPIVMNSCEYNYEYLEVKKEKMGHLL
ncbi:GTP cyclohydrolase II [bacterium]|jgi:GTP cyclohydrolase II|nr:GTP cyclohydrolase II [bacterium]